jgi:tetratricopeptide (TPR) repeat protein
MFTKTGDVAIRGRRWFIARRTYRYALLEHPGHAPAWLGLARAYDELGQREDAVRSYRRFLVLASDSLSAPLARRRAAALEREIETLRGSASSSPPAHP